MTEADILALTYEDLVDIYRPTLKKLENGETRQLGGLEGEVVAIAVPCALAKHSGGKYTQGQATASAPTEYSVFTRPEVDVRAGDTLVVTHLGRREILLAGRPDRHSSHNNVPVKPPSNTV